MGDPPGFAERREAIQEQIRARHRARVDAIAVKLGRTLGGIAGVVVGYLCWTQMPLSLAKMAIPVLMLQPLVVVVAGVVALLLGAKAGERLFRALGRRAWEDAK